MLERPNVQENDIILCLQSEYSLAVREVTFLPLGADLNTAVYRVTTKGNEVYFLKLRKGIFGRACVRLPYFLRQQGMQQIIPVLPTKSSNLHCSLRDFTAILYPYIAGQDGYMTKLTPVQWHELGTFLHTFHTTNYPSELLKLIQRETYSPHARTAVKAFLADSKDATYTDPVAQEVNLLLQDKHDTILDLIQRAERLAFRLQEDPPPFIICHTDLHAGNIHISPSGDLFIVDWDQPLLAPKERDLMYIGGGLMASGLTQQEEERLFYDGYGPTALHPAALAYYRYERIIQDIYEYCTELLLSDDGGADRAQFLSYLQSNFLQGGTIEIAYQTDRTMTESRPNE